MRDKGQTFVGASSFANYLFESRLKSSKEGSHGKSFLQVRSELTELVNKEHLRNEGIMDVKMIKVKSNSIRNRAADLYDITVRFDAEGIALVPEYHLTSVRKAQVLYPGRYRILEEDTVEAVNTPAETTTAAEDTKEDTDLSKIEDELASALEGAEEELEGSVVADGDESEVAEELPAAAPEKKKRGRKPTKNKSRS